MVTASKFADSDALDIIPDDLFARCGSDDEDVAGIFLGGTSADFRFNPWVPDNQTPPYAQWTRWGRLTPSPQATPRRAQETNMTAPPHRRTGVTVGTPGACSNGRRTEQNQDWKPAGVLEDTRKYHSE